MDFIQYLILTTICLSVSYLAFRLIFNKEFRFKQQRVFLLVSLALSLILPLTGFRIDIAAFFGKTSESIVILNPLVIDDIRLPASTTEPGLFTINTGLLMGIYAIITAIIISIITIQFFKILWLYSISIKTRHDKGILLCNYNIKSPFSFFRWIFIPEEIDGKEERESIIIHESIHVSQYHSVDNLLIELVAALTWFNPLVWMMKKSLHLVHEYLADEGTLDAGIDSLRYRALLINQVSEERLICLSSCFKNSLLKKRMIMMTKSKNNNPDKNRILALLPLSAILFLTTAFLNGLFPEESKGSPAATDNFGQSVFEKVAGISTVQDTVIIKSDKVKVGAVEKKKARKDKALAIKVDKTVDLKEDMDVDVDVDVEAAIDLKEDMDMDVIVDEAVDLREDTDKDVEVIKTIDPQEKVTVKIRKSGRDDIKVIGYGGSDIDTVIYVVDGVHVKKIKDINPDDIESVNVLKEDNLIIIRTKDKSGKKATGENHKAQVRIVPDDVLYIIDGKTAGKGEFEKLESGQIESVTVIKDDHKEISKYTDKDVDGIIIIKTKDKSKQ